MKEPLCHQPNRFHSLSWGDTFFLYLEREGQPLNIASTCEFEGKISLKPAPSSSSRSWTSSRVTSSARCSLPSTWAFRPGNLIRASTSGTMSTRSCSSRVPTATSRRRRRSHQLDARPEPSAMGPHAGARPEGKPHRRHHSYPPLPGRWYLGRWHHERSARRQPNSAKAGAQKEAQEHARPTDSVAILLDQLLKSYQSFMQGALTAQNGSAEHRARVAGRSHPWTHRRTDPSGSGTRHAYRSVCPLTRSAADRSRSPGERSPWPRSRPSARAGGTVNDVVLTIVTSAVRRYAEQHGVKFKGRHLRLIVPVNIRGNGDVSELGNQITFLPINVPLDVRDPRAAAGKVSERLTSSEASACPNSLDCSGLWSRRCRSRCRQRWCRC